MIFAASVAVVVAVLLGVALFKSRMQLVEAEARARSQEEIARAKAQEISAQREALKSEFEWFESQFVFVISIQIIQRDTTKVKRERIPIGAVAHGFLHLNATSNFSIRGIAIKQRAFSASLVSKRS